MNSFYSRYSRLGKIQERQTRLQILVFFIISVVLLVVIIKFGFPALLGFTGSFAGRPQSGRTDDRGLELPLTPLLEAPYTATNSAKIKISGTSDPDTSIDILRNEELITSLLADPEGKFSLTIDLLTGSNHIIAQATNSRGKKSDKSEILELLYLNSPPKLEISSPQDKSSTNQETLEIVGQTDPEVNIVVNERSVIVSSDGSFKLIYRLQPGDNSLKIQAVDKAGNKTEKEIAVKYSS